ncbi:hypothetical protein PRIPAC_92536 [Pristionchus pacificus]|uniref:FGGY_N domain-containing protein n=1 Tax=Pristionchus pacificus TaxID=54126 RepID=A0A454XZF6_PRIPA|nr:hypothetical protein PRIPAC_92536 [Pristionchus pacificus]|eukprot:PDM77848.1 hypothetical protein PRIPAC_34715 [Pristionchus pacificus]
MPSYALGIDIGTTSVKVAAKTKDDLIERSRQHNAAEGLGIQNVAVILAVCREVIDEVVEALPGKNLKLRTVAVCSQMHGVCTWNGQEVKEKGDRAATSLLYTWEYTGRNEEQMEQWKAAGLDANPGYGCVTLAHLEQQGKIDERHDRAGTVGDLLVAILCGDTLSSHSMSEQMASSFGLVEERRWVGPAVDPGRWQSLLPSIVSSECKAGETKLFGHAKKPATVYVALGDLQATMYPLLTDDHRVALNLGTSSQIAFRQRGADEYEQAMLARSTTILYPFFGNSKLIASASMNGGNMVQSKIENRLGKPSNAAIASLLQAADAFCELYPTDALATEATGLLHQERGMDKPEPLVVRRTAATNKRPIADEEAIVAVCRRVILNQLDLCPLAPHHEKLLLVGSAACARYAVPLKRALEQKAEARGAAIEIVKPDGSTSAAAGAAAFAWAEGGL